MNKIVYIANIRLPTEKAHGIQIMKTCEALARETCDITLVVPCRSNHLKEDPFLYYKIDRVFHVKKLFSLDLVFLGRIGFLIQSMTFAFAISISILKNIINKQDVVYYSRDEMQLLIPIILNQKTVWEAHMGQNNFLVKFVVAKCTKIVTISKGLKDLYGSGNKILVAPDGVDTAQFVIDKDKLFLRENLGLPMDKKIVLYTGHLYDWKGTQTLVESADFLENNMLVVFVGGTDKDLVTFKSSFSSKSNLLILGRKPHDQIPLYLKSADVLVIPNSGKLDISRLYTSPMKMFEYMASGTPIVASDLPSIREILNENNAVFFTPDNPVSLSQSINSLLQDKGLMERISLQSSRDIMKFSWQERARKILTFIYHV